MTGPAVHNKTFSKGTETWNRVLITWHNICIRRPCRLWISRLTSSRSQSLSSWPRLYLPQALVAAITLTIVRCYTSFSKGTQSLSGRSLRLTRSATRTPTNGTSSGQQALVRATFTKALTSFRELITSLRVMRSRVRTVYATTMSRCRSASAGSNSTSFPRHTSCQMSFTIFIVIIRN